MQGPRIRCFARLLACLMLPAFVSGCFSCSGSGGWERVVNPVCREGYLPSVATATVAAPSAASAPAEGAADGNAPR
ncbi:hypothetical protein Smal_0733 [Stenotrophomonas maltophilia R551-3]|uniref:Lipoprotein n=1 Tax=Stenotrophomonas maltophilia (strain R551-3) TaxID=391008 RepID=B4SKU0_STRM5|nr:hypothetical protein Smal_0733 [Stenotrophomonas maltophilia R551-3]